ncbi:Uncharacterized protein dnm_020390 [Desulfonema magnum]|uniref:Uncharacterized protein n=1 Tax=Desulfonema magnum TaxID=45655 RepID=A0A975GLN3_9BACT|nr:Uncharacterized protein dnm_020390 [Desulfonema magnum]
MKPDSFHFIIVNIWKVQKSDTEFPECQTSEVSETSEVFTLQNLFGQTTIDYVL